MTKKILIHLVVIVLCVVGQAHADECSIDRLNVTNITTIKPASGFDSSTTGRLFGLIANLYTSVPIPSNLSKLGVSGAQNTAIWGQEVIYDPLDAIEQDFVSAVEDITTLILNSDVIIDPDQLIVRINGSTVVPESSAEPYYVMFKGNNLPLHLHVIQRSFRRAATFQLIEWDKGPDDNLGLVTIVGSPVLNNSVPLPINFSFYTNVYYELVSSTANQGDLILSSDGSYSFFVGSEFDDMALNETRQVTFNYLTYGTAMFDSVTRTIGPERTVTITVTGSGTNEPAVAVDDNGATSNTSTQPLAGTTIRIFAPDPEDGSIYDVTYKIEKGIGKLDEIAERLECSPRECKDVLEPEYLGGASGRPLGCPIGYEDKGEYSNGSSNSRFRSCEVIKPTGCGAVFDPLPGVNDLKDGDVIVLQGKTRFGGDDQYLGTCRNCAQGVFLDTAFVQTIDPNRSVAQWTVKTLPNGKFALRSTNDLYLKTCSICILPFIAAPKDWTGAVGLDPFENVAQFSISAIGGGKYTVQDDSGQYLTQCPDCTDDLTSAAVFSAAPAGPEYTAWAISVKKPKVISKPLNTVVAINEVINPSDHWVIEPGGTLIINAGKILTIEDGAMLENNGVIINNGTILIGDAGELKNLGTIVNKEIIRIRKGTLDNQPGALIDNSDANHIGNDNGTLINTGVIYDPFSSRYSGSSPTPNKTINGYYVVPNNFVSKKLCELIESPSHSWNVNTNTCTIANAWVKAGKTLTVANGATLVLTGTLTNEGDIVNDGTIDNANGDLRQCNTISGNSPTTPSRVEEPCTTSAEQARCENYGGTWNPLIANTCDVRFSTSVLYGDVLTIGEDSNGDGITWNVSGTIDNFGSIHIEQNGRLLIPGGTITNNVDEDSGVDATMTNYGLISIDTNTSEGFEGQIKNDTYLYNYGSIINGSGALGYIFGMGYVDNYCGAVYSVERTPFGIGTDNLNTFYDEVCRPPDFDNDGVPDALDAFPYDTTETTDTDEDGFGDNLADTFPLNPREHIDSDGDCGVIVTQTVTSGDGCGDNSDAFGLNPLENTDTDGDCGAIVVQTDTSGNGCGDNSESFPLNLFELVDTDGDCGPIATQTPASGDGCGNNSDAFPDDANETTDSDNDDVGNNSDNCSQASNQGQIDSDGDGYGNACDPDLNNDGTVSAEDLSIFKLVFFSADPDADLNGDGVVNVIDLGIMKSLFFGPPGPSAPAP